MDEQYNQLMNQMLESCVSEDEDVEENCTPEEKIVLKAAEDGDVETLRDYIEKNKDLVKTRDSDGYTPLHRAAYNNQIAAARVLLDGGADVLAATCDGWHALHSACKWNHVEMAQFLIDNGAQVNAKSLGGNTALHLAATLKDGKELIEYLLSLSDIDIKVINKAGDMPLDIAKRSGPFESLWECKD